MSMFESPRFLSRVMWADSATSAATGAAQLVLTGWLAQSSGLPAALLVNTGLILVAYAVVSAAIASRTQTPRTLIRIGALGGLTWAVACAGLAFGGELPLTLLGKLWLGAQALISVLMADLQWTGLRRSAKATKAYSGNDIARHKMLNSSSN